MKLNLWLIVMATCYLWCAGERCPALAFQVGDRATLDISQFGAYISTNDTPGIISGRKGGGSRIPRIL